MRRRSGREDKSTISRASASGAPCMSPVLVLVAGAVVVRGHGQDRATSRRTTCPTYPTAAGAVSLRVAGRRSRAETAAGSARERARTLDVMAIRQHAPSRGMRGMLGEGRPGAHPMISQWAMGRALLHFLVLPLVLITGPGSTERAAPSPSADTSPRHEGTAAPTRAPPRGRRRAPRRPPRARRHPPGRRATGPGAGGRAIGSRGLAEPEARKSRGPRNRSGECEQGSSSRSDEGGNIAQAERVEAWALGAQFDDEI